MDQTEHETAVAAMVATGQLARVNRDELLSRLRPLFARSGPAAQAGKYIDGLSAEVPRKNGWTLAEYAGDVSPDKMQRLLNHAVWDHTAAMAVTRGFVIDTLADPHAVLVVDESGQEKKGTATAGVARQYLGAVGKVTNGINVVYASYASRHGHAVVDCRQYLPQQWAADPARRLAAGIPDQVVFKTKPQLAVDMIATLHAEGRLPGWVTGDEVYGANPVLRSWCEHPDHQIGYVLGVPRSFPVTCYPGYTVRADQIPILDQAWNLYPAGHGSKGDRDYSWGWIATASPQHHLLVRASLSDPTDLAYFWCYQPPATPPVGLARQIRVAGMRWPVEEDFQIGKSHFGLDESQVRLYTALLRHLTLSIAAAAIHAVTAAAMRKTTSTLPPPPVDPNQPPPADPGLVPVSVPETKRLSNLLQRAVHDITHHLRWAWWRRRHQARAWWHHHRTRLQPPPLPT